MLAGLVGIALISYLRARDLLHRQISETTLPLTSDTIYAGVENDLLQPVLASGLMARNTLLADKLARGQSDPERIAAYLRGVQERTGAVTAFLVSDRSRSYHHPSGVLKQVSPTDPQDRWYYRFRDSGRNFEINIDRDTADLQRTTAFINVRLLDAEGGFLGVVGLGLDMRSLMAQLQRYQERYGGRILLLDQQGRIKLAADRTTGSLEDIKGLAPHRKQILSAPSHTLHLERMGSDSYVSSRRIPELDWLLVVQQTSSLAQRRLENLLAQNLIAAVLVSLVLLSLAQLTVGRQQRELERLASTDSLTGLLNRSAFEPLFLRQVAEARNRREPLAVALIDIDRFKQVNDHFGHPQGDHVICQVGRRIVHHIRAVDLLFRWGGEEFLLLLPGCAIPRAKELLERIRRDLHDQPVSLLNQKTVPPSPDQLRPDLLPVTISIGLSVHRSEESSAELLQRVDEALYCAKRGGRDRLCTA